MNVGTITGETVTVSLRDFGAHDAYGNPVERFGEPFEVANVIVGKPTTKADYSEEHPEGIEMHVAFCFPRGFSHDLRGARVTRAGKTYEIVGDPSELTEANIPPLIEWNIRAEAVRLDG